MSLWERQRDTDGTLEPNLWYDRFTDFRLMGPERSLLGLYRQWLKDKGRERQKLPTRAPQVWHDTAERWDWRRRAELWDAENRRLRIEEEEEARREMLKRHARQAQAMQGIGAQGLRKLAQRVAELTATEIRQLIMDGIKAERQAIGLPEHLLQVAAMTDEELLDQYQGILVSLAGNEDKEPDD